MSTRFEIPTNIRKLLKGHGREGLQGKKVIVQWYQGLKRTQCGSQRRTCINSISPFILWVPETELESSGLVTNIFIHWSPNHMILNLRRENMTQNVSALTNTSEKLNSVFKTYRAEGEY